MNFYKAARPVIMGREGMVSSGHHLASLAGARVLQEGGNAIDAALATAMMMAVVKPEASGPGGDLFALVYMKRNGDRVKALNASGPAPRKTTIDFFRQKGLSAVPAEGPLSIAVPGAVDGWLELHKKYATLELARLARPAIDYARRGFSMHLDLARKIEELAPGFPDVERSFRAPLGNAKAGGLLVQKGLARTLEQIGNEGRSGFYEGEVAESICAAAQKQGGVLGTEDLQGSFAEWLAPLSTQYRDYLVLEQPPVSQGFMVLEMLNIFEGDPACNISSDVSGRIHAMVEAKKLAFEDRIAYLDDPRFGDPKVQTLISKEHARERRQSISDRSRAQGRATAPAGTDTTYLCAADCDGNAVSLIQSIFAPFGSRVIANDVGVIMNNRLCSFGLDPSKANSLAPGKRPIHTLNTYLIMRGGELFGVGGSPGADDQPQTNFQVICNLLDLEMDPQSAIESPRWSHSPGTPPRAAGPEELKMEEGFAPEVIEGLKKRGHKVRVVERWSFGSAKVIIHDPKTGTWIAGADPRREGYAIGW